MNDYLKIQFYNTCDLGYILYQTGWQQWMYFDSYMMTPEYVTDTQSVKDGELTENISYERLNKKYKLIILCPEYIADVLTLLPLHDTVILTLKTGQQAQIKEIETDVKWQGSGCFAQVTLNFITDDYNWYKACCQNAVIS